MAQIDFWYEFASTYSYLSAMRIEEQADVYAFLKANLER